MPTTVPLAAVRILRPIRDEPKVQTQHENTSDGQDPPLSVQPNPVDAITLCNEYDRTSGIEELTNQLIIAGIEDIETIPISLETTVAVAIELEAEMKEMHRLEKDLVVFQLCDGTELDGYPGVSIVQELEKRKIPFTGSDSAFYIISSSKPILKRELQKADVPTSSFKEFRTPPQLADLEDIIQEIGFPMIVKPSVSYASLNISTASVVHTPEQLLEQINVSLSASKPAGKLNDKETETISHTLHNKLLTVVQKAEIDIENPTVFVEKFLAGHEFTALVVGDREWGVKVYPVAERMFDPKLGKFERLLSFDQYWDGYDLEGGHTTEEFCKYQIANSDWQEQLQQVAKDAYLALDGTGYGRVDIRTVEMDKCEPVVLEVNANCGLSFEKDSSSMANILIMSKVAPSGFVRDLVLHALHRRDRLVEASTHAHHAVHRPNLSTLFVGEHVNSSECPEILVQS